MRIPVEERFWRHVLLSDGCWEWSGALHERGYGVINDGRRPARAMRAHRLSFEIHRGPIPDGLLVCHRCNNKRCVRPDHLYLATNAENVRHAFRDGLNPSQERAKARASCKHGHAYTPANTYRHNGTGHRQCRECHRLRARARRAGVSEFPLHIINT